MNQKVYYLLKSIGNTFQKIKCPNCGGEQATMVDQKYFFTKLLKCGDCRLNFRYPTDQEGFFDEFYQEDYKKNNADVPEIINNFPSDKALAEMMNNNFPTQRDHSKFIFALLKSYNKRVMDFGTSWGYSVFQLKKSGFDAEGFEISKPRAQFGTEKLGINIYSETNLIRQNNDLIMSNHVIEHLPKVQEFVRLAASKLSKDGLFISFCPNGSPEYQNREPKIFHVNWGFLHPNYLDIEFAKKLFEKNPYLIITGDWDYDLSLLSNWDGKSQVIGHKKDGKELLIIAKPNILLN